jgi:hypothetical protein
MATFSAQEAIGPEAREQLAQLPDLEQSINQWAPLLTYGFYGLVILAAAATQGALAAYYFTRKGRIDQFNRETSPWIRRVLDEANR